MICITPPVPIPTIRYTIWCTIGSLPLMNGLEWLWQLKYQGIDRANMAIDGIVNMPGYAESENLQELDAEARFLRAFLAFDLIKYWGDVPFKTTYTSNYEDAFAHG